MERIVIITGSTRGVGYAAAAEFLRHSDPSDLLKPGYLARRIFAVAAGKEKSGALIEVYS